MIRQGILYWNSIQISLHGLISDATYDLFNTICNYSQIRRQALKGVFSLDCSRVIIQASNEIGGFMDSYDVTLDVCLSSVLSQSGILDKTLSTLLHISNVIDLSTLDKLQAGVIMPKIETNAKKFVLTNKNEKLLIIYKI